LKYRKPLIFTVILIVTAAAAYFAVHKEYLIVENEFSGEKAYDHVLAQCNLGPRPPGSQAHEKCVSYIVSCLKSYGVKVVLQNFTYIDREKGPIPMVNIIGVLGKEGGKILIIGAHYDTRPRADNEKTPENRNKPILGANDGASGVAVLLELARIFSGKELNIELRLIFFDGEDWGIRLDEYFIGSTYYVKHLPPEEKDKIICMILLDMIGDSDLQIYMEGLSTDYAREYVDLVWNIAEQLGYSKYFIKRVKYTIYDDHYPFLKANIPAIDIIDFDYKYWHTLEDTPDKVSPKSLEIVGKTILNVILEINRSHS